MGEDSYAESVLIEPVTSRIARENGESTKFMYSPKEIEFYDRERHISYNNVHNLLENSNLDPSKLNYAVENNQIKVYEFKGEKYLDRLDIGKIYHIPREKKVGLNIERYFTRDLNRERIHPLDSVEYSKRDLEIVGTDGRIVFKMNDAEFPKDWDEVSARIVAQKYFFDPSKPEWKEKLKAKLGRPNEYSLKHLVERVTNFIVDEGYRLGYFETEEDRDAFSDELKWLQIQKRFAFNSPVQFNAGIFNEYGVNGSTGINYYRDPETGEVKKVKEGEFVHPQCHACFIKGPKDDLESIAMHGVHETAIFSSGSGIGHEIGVLRAEGESLSPGGKASGPLSFWKFYDDLGGTIKSGGKSRRAARMTTMRYKHPDILKFIKSKVGEDKKIRILMENGYEGGMEGEATTTVTFQNTNISVRLDNEFFDAVRNDKEIELKRVTDESVIEKVSARRMLKEISFGSWRVGDPAVQYEDKIQEMHTSKNSGRINSSNPCSEYMFLDDTSCNLGSHNLLAYSDERGNFDVDAFRRAVWLTTIATDIINDAASYPVEDIARISPEFRTVGIGYANLGALLMRKGITYDSEKGRAIAAAITAVMTGTSYEASTDMAEKLGTFIHYDFNREPMLDVMERHRKNLEDVLWEEVEPELKNAAYEAWGNVNFKGRKHGFRNAQTTVLAPTGTISYLMNCDTTGIEPGISLSIKKNLSGGGVVTLVNREVPNALKNLGYDEEEIEKISNFIKENNTIKGAPHVNPEHYPIFDTAYGNAEGIGAIDFEGHVRMVGAAQPFISGAISKTNNLPTNATVKQIYDGYLLGNEIGLKALAVFRNNSKANSALDFGKNGVGKLKRGEKEDLPERRNSFETEVRIGGTPIHVIFSEYPDGRPGQIAFLSYKTGSTMGSLLTTSGIDASKALKRGVSLEDVVDGWLGQEFDPKGIVSGHPYIRTASSPLDFAAKLGLLEYMGRTDVLPQEIEEEVNIEDLRGFNNGSFFYYEREGIDEWDVDQILEDPLLGGFKEPDEDLLKILSQKKKKQENHNEKGETCRVCGDLMYQYAPGCYNCERCGDRIGGCVM